MARAPGRGHALRSVRPRCPATAAAAGRRGRVDAAHVDRRSARSRKSGLAAGLAWAVATVVTGAPGTGARTADRPRRRPGLGTGVDPHGAPAQRGGGAGCPPGRGNRRRIGPQRADGRRAGRGLARCRRVGAAAPAVAARQVPVSGLIVLSAIASHESSQAGRRAVDTLLGAAVGVAVVPVLPASRLVMCAGDLGPARGWTRGPAPDDGVRAGLAVVHRPERGVAAHARTVREPLVDQAVEAVGDGRESAAGTSAIGATSKRLRVTRRWYHASSERPSASRSSHGVSTIRPPGRHDPPGDARDGCAAPGPGGRSPRVGRRCPRDGARNLAESLAEVRTRRMDRADRVRRARMALDENDGSGHDESRRSGSATPRCWCRSTGSSATWAPRGPADARSARAHAAHERDAHVRCRRPTKMGRG